MKRLLYLIGILISLFGCEKTEKTVFEPNYFTIDNQLFDIEHSYMSVSNYILNESRNSKSSLWLSSAEFRDYSLHDIEDFTSIGLDFPSGFSTIIIKSDIEHVDTNHLNEIENLLKTEISTIKPEDVFVWLNYSPESDSFEYSGSLASIENNSLYNDPKFDIYFTGTTTDGKKIECKFYGSQNVLSHKF